MKLLQHVKIVGNTLENRAAGQKRGIGMTKEERDKMLIYLAEQINNDIVECRINIARETGRINGLQMAAEQIGHYIEGRAESEDEE